MVRTADWCCPLLCCSEDRGPKRNLLTSQFLKPAELRQMLQHCYRRADRQGLMLAAMLLALGVYLSRSCTFQFLLSHSTC